MARLLLVLLLAVLMSQSHASAATISVPYGEWITAAMQAAVTIAVPALTGAVIYVVHKIAPRLRHTLSEQAVEQAVQEATDYVLNAVDGAAKGRMLTIEVGSHVIAKATQRVIDRGPYWLLNRAGGPYGIAERVFQRLHLEPRATEANTLVAAAAIDPEWNP